MPGGYSPRHDIHRGVWVGSENGERHTNLTGVNTVTDRQGYQRAQVLYAILILS